MRREKQKFNEFEAEERLLAELRLGAEATGQTVGIEAVQPEKELPLQEAA